jgi:glutamate N-acetyltransferase/amino-acid N-acetyltransferase
MSSSTSSTESPRGDVRLVEAISGGITTPKGFRAAGVSAGIKRGSGSEGSAGGPLDLALIVSDTPATAAALFTTNRVQAAPVIVSRDHLTRSNGLVRAIVVNSGCANACTGEVGLQAAREMASEAARAVGCAPVEVLVASTGVIGVALGIDKIKRALPVAAEALGRDQGPRAALAIMTTDPFPKEAAARAAVGGLAFTVGGMAKGSGMIGPEMTPQATMLGFVSTDAAVPQALLQRALYEVANETFNAITVDGECSTNDSVMLLANGASGATVDESTYSVFAEALHLVCLRLALGIVRGGEGATKLVTVMVTGARTSAEARQTAKAIANSPLVKTAIHGGDPNWGRLMAVAGRAGVEFDPNRAAVAIGPILLFQDGQPHDEAAAEAAQYLKNDEISVSVDLGVGTASSTVWTCDLSAEYVRINADYRT